MTPARPWAHRVSPATARLLMAGLGVLLLFALFLPARDPGTERLTIDWRPSAELAGLFFVIAVVAVLRPRTFAARAAAIALAGLVTAAAALNLADAAAPGLLGRDLNLFDDLRHLPSLGGGGASGLGRVAAVVGLAGVLALIAAGAYWVWGKVLAVTTDRRAALAAAIFFGVVLNAAAWAPADERPLATRLGRAAIRQADAFERRGSATANPSGAYATALAAPAPPRSDLAGLKRQDVYLVFIESYGTTVFDTPELRAALAGPLAQFEAAVRAAGFTVASNRLVSPTTGGGSWLAHATLASGIRLDDPLLYGALLKSGRKLLPAYFKDAGWRTIDIMPEMKSGDSETEAWGFDREVYAPGLDYHGPSFGWFEIPDQFTLERAGAIRDALGPAPPVFAQIVLVSSHLPFAPVPPYMADWSDAGTFSDVPSTAWDEIDSQPDWSRLAPAYAKSLQYDFAVLRDWLAHRLRGDALVILVGDHQPPTIVGGGPQPWTVPIHVLSRDPALVAPFLGSGYVAGMVPTQVPPHPGMESFLRSFLAAFNRPG
jgi:Sulfatase